MKKGQGLPLNAIIIAILVLIVLVVLALVFTGKITVFGENTKKAEDTFSFDNCEIPGSGRACQSTGCAVGTEVEGAKCPVEKPWCCKVS